MANLLTDCQSDATAPNQVDQVDESKKARPKPHRPRFAWLVEKKAEGHKNERKIPIQEQVVREMPLGEKQFEAIIKERRWKSEYLKG